VSVTAPMSGVCASTATFGLLPASAAADVATQVAVATATATRRAFVATRTSPPTLNSPSSRCEVYSARRRATRPRGTQQAKTAPGACNLRRPAQKTSLEGGMRLAVQIKTMKKGRASWCPRGGEVFRGADDRPHLAVSGSSRTASLRSSRLRRTGRGHGARRGVGLMHSQRRSRRGDWWPTSPSGQLLRSVRSAISRASGESFLTT
jgi:hypothetical protein